MPRKKKVQVNKPVEIICIIDKSGSMGAIRSDAVGGFNTFLEEQQKVKGEANLTLVLFDTDYQEVYHRLPVEEAKPLTDKTYIPCGGTAMNDAIGKTLAEFEKLSTTEEFGGGIVCILTDGMENASREFDTKTIKSMIEKAENDWNWQVVYLAANQDAFAVGSQYGFTKSFDYDATGVGTRSALSTISASTTSYRASVHNKQYEDLDRSK
jgi:hypothetical protein